jgi:hypothetical protein
MRVLSLALLAALAAGCNDPPAGSEAAKPTSADEAAKTAALERARSAGKELGGTLLRELMDALGKGEPADALDVCSAKAQAITAEIGKTSSVRVGRSSLRLRNPKNAPPPWVKAWLDEQGERRAEGVQGFARIDVTPEGEVARFLAPITVEGPCLNCHGAAATLSPRVVALLSERYPDDAATGYAAGDLRGALWAETPVEQ